MTDDILCLPKFIEHAQRALDKRVRAVAPFGTCFAHSKCKVLLQYWTTLAPNLILDGEGLTILDHFSYLGGYVTKGGSLVVKLCTRMSKVRVTPSSGALVSPT